MVASAYVPDAGDVVWLNFSPQAGHEHHGRRPALVLSPAAYNRRRGMMICCPLTSRPKGYAFEVLMEDGGAVLADQVKSLDWRARDAERKGCAAPGVVSDVRAKIRALIGIR